MPSVFFSSDHADLMAYLRGGVETPECIAR
jgi:hypothetical protein